MNSPTTPTARSGGTRSSWRYVEALEEGREPDRGRSWRRTPTSGTTWRHSSPATTRCSGSRRPFRAARRSDAQRA